jgi:hypothetical protein
MGYHPPQPQRKLTFPFITATQWLAGHDPELWHENGGPVKQSALGEELCERSLPEPVFAEQIYRRPLVLDTILPGPPEFAGASALIQHLATGLKC